MHRASMHAERTDVMRAPGTILRVVSATATLCGALCVASSAAAQTGEATPVSHERVAPLEPVATVTYERPPEPRVVPRPPIPYPHAVWVDGYWDWTGQQYVWRDGHWTAPHPGMHWRDTHWQRFGDGWVRVPGQWVR
jgi:hypothetical protein